MGGISTLIEVGVFNLFVYALGMDVVWAKIVASLVALVNAYFGNREWTFRNRDRRSRTHELILFIITNGLCTGLGALLLWIGVAMAGVLLGHEPGPVAVNAVNLVSIGIVVVVRFALYHWVVFRV